MTTIRLTAAQAMVRYLAAQKNGDGVKLIPGCWAIFGHGNVAGIGEALHAAGGEFPTWRGHWWDVAVPEVSPREDVRAARRDYEQAIARRARATPETKS